MECGGAIRTFEVSGDSVDFISMFMIAVIAEFVFYLDGDEQAAGQAN